MTDFNSKPLDNFNWDEFEKGQNSIEASQKNTGFDEEPVFKQGIAIVKRGGRYGAIMVGGKEIVPSIYEKLSEFEDGLAVAKYNDEERVINLSGQIQVAYGNEKVFIPETFDWGYNFVNDICVVIKDNKYGIIDKDFKIIRECEYTTFVDFQNGYAILGNYKSSIIVNNEGKECYKVIETFPDGDRIISTEDNNWEFEGVINKEMNLVIPVSYNDIKRLKNDCYVATTMDNSKLFLDSNTGEILGRKAFEEINDINKTFFVTYRTNQNGDINETCIYKTPVTLIISIPYKVDVSLFKDDVVKFSLNGLQFQCDIEGNLSIVGRRIKYGSSDWAYRWEQIAQRKVVHDYLMFQHQPLSKEYEIIENGKHLKGISDLEGNVIVEPQYNYIGYISNDLFIVAVPNSNTDGKTLAFGVIDKTNNVKIPFEYQCLLPINDKYVAYTEDRIYEVSEKNNYSALEFPTSGHYVNITFGIVSIAGKKITNSVFSTIWGEKSGEGFIVSITVPIRNNSIQKYGIINSEGDYVVAPKYDRISYNEIDDLFKTTISYSETGRYPFEQLTNEVSIDGHFVVHNANGTVSKVPVGIADWCGPFSDEGYAKVIKGGIKGKINNANQLVSFIDEKCIVIPEQYDFACNFNFGYAPVSKKGKFGIIDTKQKEIIPCRYEYIEPLSSTRFKFKEIDKWGIIDEKENIIANPEYLSISHQSEEFFKVELSVRNGSCIFNHYGIVDNEGKIVIPIICSSISEISYNDNVFWIADTQCQQAIYTKSGDMIIPFIYDDIELKDDKFVCRVYEQKDSFSYSNRDKRVKFENYYTLKGEQCLYIEEKFLHIVPSEYDIAYYAGLGLIWVNRDGKWGLINMMNKVIIPPSFSDFKAFNGSFAIVGNSDDDKKKYFPDDNIWDIKWGIVDTSGEIVLPIEYGYIEKLDNGYYMAYKDKLNILLSPNLSPVYKTGKLMKELCGRYLLIGDSTIYDGLIDYNGNEIIPTDEEHNFSEIEILENGFFKVTYYKGEYGSSHIAILNNRGKALLEKHNYCDDIRLLDYGFLLIERKNYDYPTTYSLANLQGEEILPDSYFEIKVLDNGMLSLRNSEGWGLADIKGHIKIEPHYLEELAFVDAVSDIRVKGSALTQKVNTEGKVIVHNGNNSIELPNSVYWGTNFINRISIVRGKGRGYDVIGVADLKGNVIIPTQYLCICLLSNKTIRVQDGDCYGIFDLKGNAIFPPIFTSIEYINQDRIKVTWNLSIITEWNRQEYTKINNYKGYGNDYLVKNRSALCNLKAEIVNDKEILFIGKFINGYARAYKEITIEDERVQMKQVGVIDTSGETIIPLIYDGIVIYEDSSYIRVRKDGKFGIAHLKSKTVKMFNELDIKHMWEIDEFGRCVYSTDCKYNNKSEDWIGGTRGVLNENGILVSAGKYNDIDLLKNGLIIVSDENGVGLLDKEGHEILPMKYSYISSFKGNYATICLGGEPGGYYNKIIGGKWGVIDSSGKFIKDCVSDNEEVLEEKNLDNCKTNNQTAFKEPSVIMSDRIPKAKERSSYDDYDYYRDDDDEGPYSKYGGYNGWDDNTIDEAFDGNPELTWNID